MSLLQRILYVDDDPDIRELVTMGLELDGGFEVRACASGGEALSMLPEFKPDMVLLDAMMPEMDGPATAAAIRRTAEGATLPIVFVTAKAQAQETKTLREAGAVDVITKPFDPVGLPQRLRDIWRRVHG